MTIVLCILSIAALGVGMLLINQATLGVGVIATAVWLAAMARIIQAGQQHKALMAKWEAKDHE